jgi:hypothetical protein
MEFLSGRGHARNRTTVNLTACRTALFRLHKGDAMRTIDELLACEPYPRLTAEERALVKADLAAPLRISLSEQQRGVRGGYKTKADIEAERRVRLKQILVFDEELRAVAPPAETAHEQGTSADNGTRRKSTRWTKTMSKEARASAVLQSLKGDPGMSDAELADKLSINRRTLQNWKKDPTIGKAWGAASRAVLPPRAVPDTRNDGYDVLDPDSPEQNRMRR